MDLSEVQQHIRAIKQERRAANSNASEQQQEIDDENLELDLEEFMAFLGKEMQENEVKEELVEAYRKFCGLDELNGGITLQQLQDTMMAYGEKRLTPQEFELLF